MPLPWSMRGLRDGVVTTRWPRRPDTYLEEFPASIAVRNGARDISDGEADAARTRLRELCPSSALDVEIDESGDGRVVVDRGRCILCGRCVRQQPDTFEWARGAEVATMTRVGLVDGSGPSGEELARLRAALASRVRAFGRSVHVRHVDAGSDGSEEAEVRALLNPVYDIHRLGIFITPSPRHADVLLVTGIGSSGMRAPLLRTRSAMPSPVVVIAAGSDACGGGLVGTGYHSDAGIGRLLDVDVWVPGSPPSPFSLLHGLLVAIGQLEPVDAVDGTRSPS